MDRLFSGKARIALIAASIDIGTNTVLLLVADVQKGKLRTLHEEQRAPRLGKGVDESRNLQPDSVERVLQVLKEYRTLLDQKYQGASKTIVTATSAVRDAGNRQEFIELVQQETGFQVSVLSGMQEAEYTYKGAISTLGNINDSVVIDIGGGSTEIAIGSKDTLLDSHSFDIGSVRFSERHLLHDPPAQAEVENCREAIQKVLHNRTFNLDSIDTGEDLLLVGVAGTATSLAFMDQQMQTFKPEAINGYEIRRKSLKSWIEELASMKIDQIKKKYPVVMQGRADIIVGGLLILEGFMKYYSFEKILVSTGGIRHGSIINAMR